jgi:hypothetical protein
MKADDAEANAESDAKTKKRLLISWYWCHDFSNWGSTEFGDSIWW